MKYIKTYEDSNDIQYSIGDIVVCSKKYDDDENLIGYINQNGIFNIDKGNPIYGNEYKVVDIYWYGSRYNNVKTKDLYHFSVDVESVKTGRLVKDNYAYLFTLASKWIKPDEPMIGDYVICTQNRFDNEELNEFLENNIGRYVDFNFTYKKYVIQYINVKSVISHYFWNTTNPYIKNLGKINLELSDIIKYSKDKEELEKYIEINKISKKYNI